MEKIINKFQQYLFEMLGINVVIDPCVNAGSLPSYLRESYHFHSVKLLGVSSVLMVASGEKPQTPAVIGKQVEQVRIKLGVEVVYCSGAITSYDRKRLIDQKVSFVIPGNQMYLPFAGIDLREHLKRQRDKKPFFSPATQVLIFYVLYQKEAAVLTPAEIADVLGFSAMTMTRAFDELEMAGIGDHSVLGKNRQVKFVESKKPLWEKVLPYLKTPVRKRLYISSLMGKSAVAAGVSALAHYTMLADSGVKVIAFSGDEWKVLGQQNKFIEIPSPDVGSVEVELWSYSPDRFAQVGYVDRLSLYLSLRDSVDERVQSALESILEGMKW